MVCLVEVVVVLFPMRLVPVVRVVHVVMVVEVEVVGVVVLEHFHGMDGHS